MPTYTLPAYVINADSDSIPVSASTTDMVFVAPNSATSFSYDVVRVEDFDGLGNANVVSLNQTIISKTINGGTVDVPETNYHAIFEVTWGGGNRSIVMVASANETTRVGIVLDGDPFPTINSLSDYYGWVDSFSSLSPVTTGPFAPGQQINFSSFPGVDQTASSLTIGTPGDDTLEGGPGNDAFDGLAGIDTAVFEGAQSNYTLEISRTGFVIEDHRPDGQGRDTLANVEFLDFGAEIPLLGGQPMNLDMFDGAVNLSQSDFLLIIELYIAYFDRAPDAVGLLFWANAFADGTSLQEMAALFIDQDETRATYPASMSNTEIATAVYSNVLGRTADADGFTFWVDALNSGSVSRDQFILAVLEGAKADPPAGASQAFIDQQLADRDYLSNKTDIGQYFAVNLGMSDVGNASSVMDLFDGSTASISSAVSAADGFYGAAQSASDGEFLMPLIGILDSPF